MKVKIFLVHDGDRLQSVFSNLACAESCSEELWHLFSTGQISDRLVSKSDLEMLVEGDISDELFSEIIDGIHLGPISGQ